MNQSDHAQFIREMNMGTEERSLVPLTDLLYVEYGLKIAIIEVRQRWKLQAIRWTEMHVH